MKELRFLLSLEQGRRRWILGGLALALLAAGDSVGLVATAGWLITASALAGAAGAALEIFAPGALVRAFAVTRTLARYGERLVLHEAVFRIMARLRRRVFAGMAAAPWARLITQRRSLSLTRMLADVETLENVHAGVLAPWLAATGATLLLALAAALLLPAPFALLALLLAVLLTLACLLVSRVDRPHHLRTELRRDRARRQLLELLEAHRELFFADPGDRQTRNWLRRDHDLTQAGLRQNLRAALGEAGIQLITAALLICAVLAAAVVVDADAGNAPWLVLFVLGLLAAAGLWSGLPEAWHNLAGIGAATRRLRRETAEAGTAKTGAKEATGRQAPTASGWTLEGVTLRRGVAEAPLLRDFHLELAPGETLCITGSTGCGKTSLVEMLCGLLTPVAGSVRLDGEEVSELSESRRFTRVAVLPQETTLLSASLADNLRLGNPRADEESLRQALTTTGLGHLADRLDQWVGLNGRDLSGGEARRVALIRAVLTPSAALILDEPFRGLDADHRARVLDWVLANRNGRTLILVSHEVPDGWKPDRALHLQGPPAPA